MKKIVAIAAACLSLAGCLSDDHQWVSSRATNYYEARGFKVVGYQGYDMHPIGRCYWYVTEHNGTLYESCLLRWGDEVHEYSLSAKNAIKGD